MSKVSLSKKARIHALLSTGLSTRKVAHNEGVSQSTATRLYNLQDTSRNYRDLPRSGRPRLFTERDERRILRLLSSGECETAVDIQRCLKSDYNVNVSADTVRRTLQRNGLVARVKRKKPLLRKNHVQNALPSQKDINTGQLKTGIKFFGLTSLNSNSLGRMEENTVGKSRIRH